MFGEPSGLDALLHRRRPSSWQLFLQNPCIFLARILYSWRRIAPASQFSESAISVVCVSDTHNSQCSLPDGDILIHAGDLTQSGSLEELQATVSWLKGQSHIIKIVIAGNHDLLLDATRPDPGGKAATQRDQIDWGDIRYLQDSATAVICKNGRRVNIYGSPKSPQHGNWAFQYRRLDNVWRNSIPDDTDILVTHGPPRAHLDLTTLGCVYLLRELWRVHPALHVFGHVHEGYGHEWIQFDILQDAYERTISAGGGIWNLLAVFLAFMYSFFRPPVRGLCQLVNPSMVGGLRNDIRRQPIKVYI
ncbi:Metallo-dependent phosphatase [Hypoxylon rubiginosum]|uniref:Metallo-dependent phosphatase n=1 Tax=Hypoxylon rubiginosum TaxID=110542 RepID=A0ACC0CRV3_9PEZI|nr:Metallo-dependent phosphatase [Hypoxylon rubiginosum]